METITQVQSVYYQYKKVKEDSFKIKKGFINDLTIIEKITNISKFFISNGSLILPENMNLKTNTKDWIKDIITHRNNPSIIESTVKSLLNEFCSNMKTRQREEDKYGIIWIHKEYIALAHVQSGEDSIGLDEQQLFKSFERFWDNDIVIRYVIIRIKENNLFDILIQESSKSEFFEDFLGIAGIESFRFGGPIRFQVNLFENLKIVTSFELQLDQFGKYYF
ncbi:MAG: hypothetical protein HeimC3_43670 [Candidatus Heimdallarchaeota archaeon LC_3]|nr:MAG: hypothetical protein HeimC3_43670 [Candidatus Heimdallarchaeota archaeon LC_3]